MFEAILFSVILNLQSGPANLPPASSILSALPARNVGFTSSGRGPLAVYEKDPNLFYAASCNGGVLKTVDAGHTFKFVFDKQGSANIGAMAMSQKNPDVIWVGTGDCALRNGVGWRRRFG